MSYLIIIWVKNKLLRYAEFSAEIIDTFQIVTKYIPCCFEIMLQFFGGEKVATYLK